MAFLFFFLMGYVEDPVLEIMVENRGRYLDRIVYGKVRLQPDGSFLANNFHMIYHWDEKGRLIRQMGGRGEGPGEFQAISEVLFNGEYYWVVDGARMESSVFDKNGSFLYRSGARSRQFVQAGDQLFMVDNSQFNPHGSDYPQVLQEILLKLDDQSLSVDFKPLRFKKVSQRQKDFRMNFKLVWMVREGDRYLLVDQLEPKIRIYDKSAIERESQTDLAQPFEPDFLPLNLKHWVEPPESMVSGFANNNKMLQWWQSWSRINFFDHAGDGFVIAYETPDPADPNNNLQVIQRLEKTGANAGKPLVVDGLCMGVRNNLAYIFTPDEKGDEFKYYIRAYNL